jgi:hypothetical protein
MLIEADRLPVAVGVKVTVIMQLRRAATELPQVFVSAKSPASVPVMARLAISRIPLPRLRTEMVWAALVVPTTRLGNESFVGEKEITGRLAADAALVAEKATLQGAERKASPTMAARRTGRFIRAYCRALARVQDVSLLRARRA